MTSYVTRKTPGDTAWFTRDRFGMFIHWGLVLPCPRATSGSRPARRISEEKYDKYFEHFDPDLFDAREWARQAKAAGMKYAVLTTKHHEGFCMWDTQVHRLQVHQHPRRPRSRSRIRGRVPRRGSACRLLLFADRLASSRISRSIMLHPRRDDRKRGGAQSKNPRHAQVRRVHAQSGHGAADQLRQDRRSVVRLLVFRPRFPRTTKPWMRGKGRNDWEAEELIALARTSAAGHHHRQPHRDRAGRLDARAVPADRMGAAILRPASWLHGRRARRSPAAGAIIATSRRGRIRKCCMRMLVNTVSLGGNLLMNVGTDFARLF